MSEIVLLTEEETFPDLPIEVEPLGNRILVQLRYVKSMSKGGIALVQETRATVKYNEVIAKVRKLGPLAYRYPNDLSYWKEGPWCKEGDIVRTIKWGGDRWSVPHGEDYVHYIIVNDSEIIAKCVTFDASQRQISFVD